MKTWLFALLQSLIAVLGLAAYFLADNWMLATVAAMAAAVLGAAQPIIAASKSRRLQAYQDAQYQKSFDAIDSQIDEIREQTTAPPFPHRATIQALFQQRFGERAEELMRRYDLVIEAIADRNSNSEGVAAEFSESLGESALGSYLMGLAQYATGRVETAYESFRFATQQQPAWIAPWLGWAATAFSLQRWDEISARHPHIAGVELFPYGAGDESTFLALNETEREELTAQFQQSAVSLGSYYTLTELTRSREQAVVAREELKKVA